MDLDPTKVTQFFQDIFYVDWNINLVNVFINLTIILLTTGLTYFLFTRRPKKKREKKLKKRLKKLHGNIFNRILRDAQKFNNSYKEKGDDEVEMPYVKIKHKREFMNEMKSMLTLARDFKRVWRGEYIISLLNGLALDNEVYIDLSVKLEKFKFKSEQLSRGLKNDYSGFFHSPHEYTFSYEEKFKLFFEVRKIKKIQELSREINKIIRDILDEKIKVEQKNNPWSTF